MQTLATLNTHCAEMMGILDAKQIKPSGEFIKKVRSPTLFDIRARNNVTVKENSGKKGTYTVTTLSPPNSIKKTFDKHPIKYKLVGKKSTIDGPEWTYEMAFDPNKVDKKYLKDAAFADAYSDDEIDEKQKKEYHKEMDKALKMIDRMDVLYKDLHHFDQDAMDRASNIDRHHVNGIKYHLEQRKKGK